MIAREEKKLSSSRQFSSSCSAAPRMGHEFPLWEAVVHAFFGLLRCYTWKQAQAQTRHFLAGSLLLGDPRAGDCLSVPRFICTGWLEGQCIGSLASLRHCYSWVSWPSTGMAWASILQSSSLQIRSGMSRPYERILTPLTVNGRAFLRTFDSPTALKYQLESRHACVCLHLSIGPFHT